MVNIDMKNKKRDPDQTFINKASITEAGNAESHPLITHCGGKDQQTKDIEKLHPERKIT